jgi:hypothetical protein
MNQLFRPFGWVVLFLLTAFPAIAQIVPFSDSLVDALPYRVKNLDEVEQFFLDQINNQPLPPEQKHTFLRNYHSDLNFYKRTSGFGNTYFENEKAAYPHCMHSMIFGMGYNSPGHIAPAKDFMQAKAIYDIGSTLTDTVDFFPSFTLKGQVPKYFYFGQFAKILDSTYLAKMRKGMGLWTFNGTTPTDPLLRPNPFYVGNTGCYDCQCRNSWVDTRNTDNLKAMRETSAYLFTEEIGNEVIRDTYFNRLRNHVGALWHVGYSEWDSETYASHSFGPFFNLFAYTRSVPAKKIGKAALDWYMMAASLKYFQAMSTGPSKRSNASSNRPLGANASDVPYLFFGDDEIPDSDNVDRDRDSYIQFLSGYRPPQAIRQLALKQHRLPAELLNSKPPYGSFSPSFANKPDAFETMYFGKTFQMGSVVSAVAVNDMRPFKLGAFHPSRKADVFYVNTSDADTIFHAKNAGDQIGQYQNLLIFLHKNDNKKFSIQMPSDIPLDSTAGVWFFRYAKTWIAVRPAGAQMTSVQNLNGIYSLHKMYLISPGPATYSALAIEVADDDAFTSFDDFKAAVLAQPFNPAMLQDSGQLVLNATDGKFLKVRYNNASLLPWVYRNSTTALDYANAANYNVYKSVTPPSCFLQSVQYDGQNLNLAIQAKDSLWGPVFQNWKSGKMKILTNDHYFEGQYNAISGEYAWKELGATEALRRGKLAFIQVFAGSAPIWSATDSLLVNQINIPVSLPFGQSGTFTFRVRVVDEEGNEAWSNDVVYSITSVSKEIWAKNSVRIAPNPATSDVQIQSGISGLARIQVFSAEGKLQVQTESPDGNVWLNTSAWKKGLYFLRIKAGQLECTKPLVKE